MNETSSVGYYSFAPIHADAGPACGSPPSRGAEPGQPDVDLVDGQAVDLSFYENFHGVEVVV
jgi:hypothetical protein